MDMLPALSVGQAESLKVRGEKRDPIQQAAEDFEAVFVKQMLQYAGLAEAFGMDESSPVASFGDFVLEKIADDIVQQGGFGLAENFYDHLKSTESLEEDGSTAGALL